MKQPKLIPGERELLTLQDGTEVEGVVRDSKDEEDAWIVRYFIPEWNDYKTGEWRYPKGVGDTSGIEKHTNMPIDYAGKYLSDFNWRLYPQDTTEQRELVEMFVDDFEECMRQRTGIYLHSATRGSGKSYLACIIGNEIIKRYGLTVKFVSMAEYISMDKDDRAEFRNATVLIVDDIGVQDDKKEWVSEIVYNLINKRYEKGKITIFTSNVDKEDCSKDDRVISRVQKMASAIKIPEVSIRAKQAKLRDERWKESLRERRRQREAQANKIHRNQSGS